MAFELRTAQYNGPLDKLLELIEERELEITEISLAAVTDEFLKYLESLKQVTTAEEFEPDLRILADFIVVASRLIFIKSKSLLPDLTLTQDEEADIKELESRLQLYKEFRPALRYLQKLWREGAHEFGRQYFLNMAHWLIPRPNQNAPYPMATLEQGKDVKFFYPGEQTTTAALQASLGRMYDTLKAITVETEVVRDKIISLEEKISEVISRVETIRETSFRHLSHAKSRSEMIVTFLALLHLAREQLIFLEQAGHLSDIIIKKNATTV
jgi:segregation and condensation protein A